jgi:hypothetical protein
MGVMLRSGKDRSSKPEKTVTQPTALLNSIDITTPHVTNRKFISLPSPYVATKCNTDDDGIKAESKT